MRRDSEHFGDRELALVYIARRLREAQKLEAVLTEASYDYLVEADTYRGGFLFFTERVGAFFYVATEREQDARALLVSHGFRPYEVGG